MKRRPSTIKVRKDKELRKRRCASNVIEIFANLDFFYQFQLFLKVNMISKVEKFAKNLFCLPSLTNKPQMNNMTRSESTSSPLF